MKKRNLWLVAIFSVITCGIYAIYWACAFENETFKTTGEGTGWKKHLLLLLVTLGFYGIFWSFVIGKRIKKLGHPEDMSMVFFILSVLGLFVVRNVWLQFIVNPLIEKKTD